MTTEAAAEEQIRKFLTENFPYVDGAGVDREQSLVEAGVIDSTGVLELVGWLEDTFELRIPLEDLVPENLDSIANATRYVASRTSEAA